MRSLAFLFRCFLLAVLPLAGCQSYTIVQRNIFSDDDGNQVALNYGRSDKDHVNTFISPATQAEMEFRSRLVVEAELPDGDTIRAWQCMNFLPYGTMYMTDNREWKVLVNGFSVSVFHRTGEPSPRDYLEVYRGVICDTPKMEVEKNDKWREVLRNGREYKRPKPLMTK